MILSPEMQKYVQKAIDDGFAFVIICRDLEDRDIFPMYFHTKKEVERYCSCIISESKIEVMEIVETSKHNVSKPAI